VAPGTVQTEMSNDRRNFIVRSQRLSGATEDCSIVRDFRVQQPRTLCRQRCCMSASRHMFGSLWNAAAAHEHRRQDGSRRPGTMAKYYSVASVCRRLAVRNVAYCG